MIFATDKGRMCNNMLQYGHVYSWAREHGRKSLSLRFCHKYPYFKISHSFGYNFLTYILVKAAAYLKLIPTVHYNDGNVDFESNEQAMLCHNNVIVSGWCFSCCELFVKYKQEIIDMFTFDEAIRQKAAHYMGSKRKHDLRLGVHIRRGDYKTWHGGKYYYEDSVYIDYIKQFQQLFPEKKLSVYVCSNDPNLNKEAYYQALPQAQLLFPQGGQEDDLCLLSECDYLIGAPSTFSLVASMYHNTPLCWMEEKDTKLSLASFSHFNDLFKHIK